MVKPGPSGFEGLSTDAQARFRQLWKDGARSEDLCAEFKVSRRTVYAWGSGCGVARGEKRPAHAAESAVFSVLERGIGKSAAARSAMAAKETFGHALAAAAPHYWRGLSEDLQRKLIAALADRQSPEEWLRPAARTRLQTLEDAAVTAFIDLLTKKMAEGLAQGDDAALQRVIDALSESEAGAEWLRETVRMALAYKGQTGTLEKAMARRRGAQQKD